MTRIAAEWVTRPQTRRVMQALGQGRHQAFFVGGCVRNALIDAPVEDIDISTDARPERVIELAEAAKLKAVPTGIEHGTITVVSGGIPHEVTTFRKDVETFGRHAVVAFSTDIEDDARRRDFTMNALYADAEGRLHDPLDGLPDLRARHVRFIDDPEQRIREDYLRILRFFRFHAWYGDPAEGLNAEGLAAAAALADGLETLSRERVGAETKKLLSAPDPSPAVAAMAQAPILFHVLPGADAERLPVLVHLEQAAGVAPDPIRRLALLGGQEIPDRLRLSKAEGKRLHLLRDGIGSEAGTAELAYRQGPEAARDIELLRAATFEAPLPAALEDDIAAGAKAVFPVKAADLMPRYHGPELGRKLAELERRWIASRFTLDRDALLG